MRSHIHIRIGDNQFGCFDMRPFCAGPPPPFRPGPGTQVNVSRCATLRVPVRLLVIPVCPSCRLFVGSRVSGCVGHECERVCVTIYSNKEAHTLPASPPRPKLYLYTLRERLARASRATCVCVYVVCHL